MRRAPRILALAALLAALPARADVTLSGAQHIGDADDPAYAAAPTLAPKDPVTRAQMKSNPTHFYLSQATTVTDVRLTDEIGIDGQLQVFIDDMNVPLAGTRSGSCATGGTCIYSLGTPVTLPAGSHTIWPDGGCSAGAPYAVSCGFNGENDFAFSSIVLTAAQGTTAGGNHRRWHLGDTADVNDNYGGRWYPDAADGGAIDIGFTADITRVVTEIRFWNLRDVSGTALSNAAVTLDGVSIGALSANGNPFSLYPDTVVAAGAHTLHIAAGLGTPTDEDDLSWDDVVIILVNNPATTPGAFNAVEHLDANVAGGRLYTRTAGAAIDLDIVAVSSLGAPLTTYTGAPAVELLDASSTSGLKIKNADGTDSNCDAGWVSLGSVALPSFGDADGGRKDIAFTYADALANARLKISDSALGVIGCSADNFAIKPDHYDITVSHNDWMTPGTSASLAAASFTAASTPIHKAGQPFTLVATAKNAAGATTASYVPTSVTYDQSASTSLLGATVGAGDLTTSMSWAAGVGTSNAAVYKEVGAVRFAIKDTTFAAVDAGDGTSLATRTVGPSYVNIGRFVPDHFKLVETTAAQFAPACVANGGFTYVGQPFTFVNTPVASLTAVAADDSTTTNYDGALYKLHVAVQSTYDTSGQAFATLPDPDNDSATHAAGVTTYTVIPRTGGYAFTRAATPVVPFSADIKITPVIADDDYTSAGATPVLSGYLGASGADGVVPFVIGGVESAAARRMRYGQLVIDSAHGSERLPLNVPLRAEYFETLGGSNGFVRNLLDSCTQLAAGVIAVTPGVAGSTTLSEPNQLLNGVASPQLSAPNVPEQVLLQAQILGAESGAMPWLLTGPAYASDPTAIATFGVFKNDVRRIYQREVVN